MKCKQNNQILTQEVYFFMPEDNPQVKNKGGRPAGSTNLASHRAARRLAQLDFDPIGRLVDQYNQIEVEIGCMMEAKGCSQMALAKLMEIRQKITADLLRYGYARVSESNVDMHKQLPPININLTPADFKGEIVNTDFNLPSAPSWNPYTKEDDSEVEH